MKRVFIIHGWNGKPNEHWLPWLKTELEKEGFEVSVPDMQDSDNPVIKNWVGHLANLVGVPDEDTYFVGHSIGCQTILRYLDSYRFGALETVGGALFVAGWFNLVNMETDEEKKIAKPWIETPINPIKTKTVLPKSVLIISDDDPYDCLDENIEKFKEIGSTVMVLKNAGHITTDDGFTELPIVFKELLKMAHEN